MLFPPLLFTSFFACRAFFEMVVRRAATFAKMDIVNKAMGPQIKRIVVCSIVLFIVVFVSSCWVLRSSCDFQHYCCVLDKNNVEKTTRCAGKQQGQTHNENPAPPNSRHMNSRSVCSQTVIEFMVYVSKTRIWEIRFAAVHKYG